MHSRSVPGVVSPPRVRIALLGIMLACCDPFADPKPIETTSAPPSVIVISMDTLRADHLGCYGYHRDTSVNIDALAARGVRFDAMSSTSAWTTPAHGSLFASRYPAQLGVVTFDGRKKARSLKQDELMLAEVLKDAGYETQAFTGGGYVSRKLGLGQGFDEYRDLEALQGYLADLMTWLDERDSGRPLFLFVHFYNTHRPYRPPVKEFKEKFKGGYKGNFPVGKVCQKKRWPLKKADLDFVVSQYDGEIAHADHLLGKFFSFLEQTGLDRNALIVFLSDHGEEFFEHGGCDHVTTVYEELIRVPFIVIGPGIEPGRVIEAPASIIDVAPTILDYLDLPVPGSMQGVSLLPAMRGEGQPCTYQFSETGLHSKERIVRGVRAEGWKLILDHEDNPVELYDLEHDALEKHNLLDARGGVVEALVEAFGTWRRQIEQAQDPSAGAEPQEVLQTDPELLERLKALGYAE